MTSERWRAEVPKDPLTNLKFRKYLVQRGENERLLRAGIRDGCKRDIFFWINTFVWQYNPSKREWPGEIGPFITWDFQEEAVREIEHAIDDGHDLVIEKSREMGASWLCLIVMTHRWLFRPWQKFLVISRNQDAVDRLDDPDSLFWKIEFILSWQPRWILGGWAGRRNRKAMSFVHPNGSVISGQASTGKAGVGGRATAMFVDEFSQIDDDRQVLSRTSDTTKCRIFNGTHLGLDTAFFELCRREDMRKLRMHWTQHPDKRQGLYEVDPETRKVKVLDQEGLPADYPFVLTGTPTGGVRPFVRSPWYDAQCRRKLNQREVAMDLDIDPQGSVSQFFDPVQVYQLKREYACEPYWVGEIDCDRNLATDPAFASGGSKLVRLWCRPGTDGKPPPGRYSFGADVSEGVGATPSCLSGMNSLGEKIFEYVDPLIDEVDFAVLCVAACRLFSDPNGDPAFLAWEAAGPGVKFGRKVIELGFRNIWWNTAESRLSKPTTDTPGWIPNSKSKDVLLRDYRDAIYRRRLINRSEKALDECMAFQYTGRGKVSHAREESPDDPSGAGECHADRVIADALMWMMGMKRKVAPQNSVLPELVVPGTLGWRRQMDDARRRSEEVWS